MWSRLTIACVLCIACGSSPEPTSTSGASFLTGLPSRETLRISGPGAAAPAALSEGSPALLGQTAALYVVTRRATAQVNALVGQVLSTVESVARTPPTSVQGDTAVWGPMSDPLSPVAGRLVIQQVGPGAHAFRVDLRPRTAPDSAFETFLGGASTGATPGGPSAGALSADLDVAHRLDPVAQPAGGQLVAGWNVAPDARQVTVHVTGVPGDPGGLASSGEVSSLLRADGSGELSVDARGDLDGDPSTEETGTIGSRWVPSGAGRADVSATGDAGQDARATECWDATFLRVFASTTTADGGTAAEGDPSACAFARPLR